MMAGREPHYVLALAAPGLPPRFRVLGRTFRTLHLGDVDAIVERPRDHQLSTEALQEQHAIVCRLSSRTPALLPARYGSLVGERELRAAVAGRRAEILHALTRVRDRRQMTLRVFGDPDRTLAPEESPTTGAAFLQSRRARAQHVPPEVHLIRSALKSLITAERVQRGEGRLRVTIYHLVKTDDAASYEQIVQGLDITPHGVVASGPWPAFAFAPELF